MADFRSGTPPFSHSSESSFVPVHPGGGGEAGAGGGEEGDFLYMGGGGAGREEARLQEELRQRRSLLVAQMEDLRSARELLSQPSIETGIRGVEEWGHGGRRTPGGGCGDGRSSSSSSNLVPVPIEGWGPDDRSPPAGGGRKFTVLRIS